MKKKDFQAFTLVEILVSMAILAILATAIVTIINPAQRLAQARNLQRQGDVAQILGGIGNYVSEPGNAFTDLGTVTTCPTTTTIGTSDLDLQTSLVGGGHLPELPQDPTNGSANDTGYRICITNQGRVTISAPNAELSESISITR